MGKYFIFICHYIFSREKNVTTIKWGRFKRAEWLWTFYLHPQLAIWMIRRINLTQLTVCKISCTYCIIWVLRAKGSAFFQRGSLLSKILFSLWLKVAIISFLLFPLHHKNIWNTCNSKLIINNWNKYYLDSLTSILY